MHLSLQPLAPCLVRVGVRVRVKVRVRIRVKVRVRGRVRGNSRASAEDMRWLCHCARRWSSAHLRTVEFVRRCPQFVE